MPDERTCRTCWHWGVIGLCGHPDTGGAAHGADDTCCNHLAIVGRGGDWQPHEQLSGGSSPAEDWREPMVQMSSSSNPPEAHVAKHLRSGLTHGRLDAMTGQIICPACGGSGWQNNWRTTAGTVCTTCNGSGVVDAEPPAQDTLTIMAEWDKLQARVAELDAELENERRRVAELSRDNWNLHEALSVAEAEMQPTEVCPACNGDVPWGKPGICYLCGNMGVVTKERLLRIDAFRQCEAANKRVAEMEAAVTTLEDRCDEYAAALNDRAELCDRLRAYYRRERRAVEMLGRELETRSGICACDVQDGWEQHRAGNTVGACWAAWAREQARAETGGK